MTLTEILPSIQNLKRADKLRLMEWLATELKRDDTALSDWENEIVSVWSPHDAYEGAATLLQALAQDRPGGP